MRLTGRTAGPSVAVIRAPAVAGSFYPGDPAMLERLVDEQLADAARRFPAPPDAGEPLGMLVPHAGLVYSGVVAAAAWRLLARTPAPGPASEVAGAPSPPTTILLGTNHRAAWLTGLGVWAHGAWRTPLGDVPVDAELAAAILGLGEPFVADPEAHAGEHSIEVQLPFLRRVEPDARIVPVAVSCGTGAEAVAAGGRLGGLVAEARRAGLRVAIAISTDMAHYPSHRVAAQVTGELEGCVRALDAQGLATAEAAVRARGDRALVCGMCGIEPAVVGLAAVHAAGATRGVVLAEATSFDAGGPPERTVGYLAAAFDAR